METFEMLCEQVRCQGQRLTANMTWWLDWRAKNKEFQLDPLDVYIERMRYFKDNINRAWNRANGWDVNVEEDDCYRQGIKQNWRCAITGDELEFTRGGQEFLGKWANPLSCSMDRIDPIDGYCRDNLQLVTWQANVWKNGFTMRQLSDLVVKAHRTICQNH